MRRINIRFSLNKMVIEFKHPFTMIVSGPSGSGKTTFTINLINNLNRMVDISIKKILWCYSEENALRTQKMIKDQQRNKISYHKGLPDSFDNENDVPMLIILDDLMMEASSAKICEVFTTGSHHRNQSVLLLTQNVFYHGKHCRDISLNTKYMVVFKNPRDQTQFRYLARQICPENTREMLKIYKEVTDIPHNYLLLDLTQNIHDSLRYRTNVFNEHFATVYCNEKNMKPENESIESLPIYAVRVEQCRK